MSIKIYADGDRNDIKGKDELEGYTCMENAQKHIAVVLVQHYRIQNSKVKYSLGSPIWLPWDLTNKKIQHKEYYGIYYKK